MKRILITIFGLSLFLGFGNQALASVSWNTASNDCPTVAVANHTTQVGKVDPCWPLATVSASPDDSVNVRIYYHNTGNETATNVRVVLNAQTGSSTSHSFSGQIISDQGSISFGPVRATTSSSTTLKLGNAFWLPNRTQSPATLLNGQTGSKVLTSSGLSIGSIAPGWESQGSVVVAFEVVGETIETKPSGTLTAANSSCSIPVGKNSCQINFSWNTTNPVGISAITRDGGSTVATGNSGSKAFTIPYNTATFGLYNNALKLDSETVSSYCTTGTTWNGSVCAENVNPNYNCSITNFTVGGGLSSTVTTPNSVELAWTSTGCNYVNISNVGNNLPANSTQTIYPSKSTTYTIVGYGNNGASQSRSVSVTVNSNPDPVYSCSITKFKANGSSSDIEIDEDDDVDIEWDTDNCTYVSISGIGSNLSDSGSRTVYPSRDTRYTITAYGSVGSTQTRHIDVEVEEENNDDDDYCSIDEFSVSDSNIVVGENTRLEWETDNCSSVRITDMGSVSDSGSRTINPNRTTTYVLSAYSSATGTRTRSVTVYVDPYVVPPINPPVYNSCAVTTVATNITQNSATLNGLITGANGGNTYFEYGPTVNLGSRTNTRYVGANSNFSETISGLSSNTIYYFRMFSDCQGSLNQGAIAIFKTLSKPVTTTTTNTVTRYIEKTTTVGTESPVMLKIENRFKEISIGDIIDYTVTYKNIGKGTLEDAILQVVVPKGIVVTNVSEGSYLFETNTVTAELGDLLKGQEGEVYLRARVDTIPENMAQVVTTAILVYTNTNGAQENAIAYVLNNPRDFVAYSATDYCDTLNNKDLTAVTFWSGFGRMNLIEWLIVIILILLAVLVARSIFTRVAPKYVYKDTPHA